MARLYQTGFELNSNASGVEWTTSTGGFATTTTNARSGTYCGRANASASAVYMHSVFRTDTLADIYLRAYVYIATAPSAQTTIMAYGDSASFYGAKVKLNTGRTLTLTNADGTLSATGSTTLALNTWYRIELYYDETNDQGTVRLDGATEIAATTIDDVGGGGKAVFGVVDATTADIYFDDIAINDTTGSYQNSWSGSGKIIHLNPDSAGDSSSWTGYVGSGANWERVDETTPNDATDGVRSRTTNEVDEYGLTASGIGSSDTVNVVAVGFRANRSTGTTSSTFNVRVKDSSAGTVDESATFTASTTAWRTNTTANNNAAPYPLVSYTRPGGAGNWTSTYLDSAQIGVKTVSGSGDRYVQLSTIWASIDYTPASFTTSTSSSTSTTTSSTSSSTSLSTSTSTTQSFTTSTSSTSSSVSTSSTSTSLSTSTSSTSSSTSLSTSTSTSTSSTSTSTSSTSSSTSQSTSTSLSTSSTSTSTTQSFTTSTSSTSSSTSTSSTSSSTSTSQSTSTSSTSTSQSTSTTVSTSTSSTSTSTTFSTSTSTSTSSTSSSTSRSTSTSSTSQSTSTSSTSSSTSTSISTSSTSTSMSTSSSTSSTSTSMSTSTTTSTSTSSTSSSTTTSSTSVSTSTTTVVERDTTYTATMANIQNYRHKMHRGRVPIVRVR